MPKTRLTAKQRKQAEEALSKAQDSQTDFWDDLHALEEVLGIEVSGDDDLSEVDIDTLLAQHSRPEAR